MISCHCVISVSCFLADAARVELRYRCDTRNAVCSSRSHLFLYEYLSRAVNILTWDGTSIKRVELLAPVDGHEIWGIQYIAGTRQLVTAWGTGDPVSHLNATTVSWLHN